MKGIKLLLIPMLLISLDLCAQTLPMVSREILDYDYLSHKYEHLDENFKIHISSEKFQSIMEEYKFIPERIDEWKDSIGVITMGEFNNWHKSRIAKSEITLSYLRVSYYLWLSEKETEAMCKKYKFNYVSRFYDFISKGEADWDQEMTHFMDTLRAKVAETANNPEVLSMTQRKFLSQALLHNPERKRAFAKQRAERHLEMKTKNRHQNPR